MIDKGIDLDKYTSVEFGRLEKNHKAKQLILNGLTRLDVDKVMSIPTAKEVWEAIQVLHKGSKDDQMTLRFDLQREFHSFTMKNGETIGSYHSRFQILCDKMKASGIDMSTVNTSLPFIHGVDARYTTSKRIMLMSKEAQSLNVAELAGKFALEERDAGSSSKSKENKSDITGTALKLKKVLKMMDANVSDEEMGDEELVLMSSIVKKYIKKRVPGRSSRKEVDSSRKRDSSEVTCYNCDTKGHYARECPKPKKESDPKAEKKVFFTGAWSDSDSDDSATSDRPCLMAN